LTSALAAGRTLVVCTFSVVEREGPVDWTVFELGDKNDTVAFANPGGIEHRTFRAGLRADNLINRA
jgi:hypothetical protein